MLDEVLGWSVLTSLLIGLGLLSYFYRRNRMTSVFVVDYQRALRFRDGKFVKMEGPGAYWLAKSDRMEIVDLRPQPIVLEQLAFEDKSGVKGVISLGTELLVKEPYLATTKLQDQLNDSLTYFRDCFRRVTAARTYDEVVRAPQFLSKNLEDDANTVLAKVGMTVRDIEITEMWIAKTERRD